MITIEQAEKLPTHRLLAYYKSLSKRACYSDCTCKECIDDYQYRQDIKAILDTREHISKEK